MIKEAFLEAGEVLNNFLTTTHLSNMEEAIKLLSQCLKNGRVYSCGNGGSMCDAMHFAEELTGRFRSDRIPLPAMAISDPAHITCVANDYGFDQVFSRTIQAFGQPGDILLAISTSGNSPNVINAINAARAKGMKTIALLGKDGGKIKDIADISLIVPSNKSERIQEVHIKCIHIMIEGIEKYFFSL